MKSASGDGDPSDGVVWAHRAYCLDANTYGACENKKTGKCYKGREDVVSKPAISGFLLQDTTFKA